MPIRRTPPAAVSAAARRGLAMYEDGKGGDGLKPETIRRARSIAAGEAQSIDWLTVEAPAWFARHAKTRPEGDAADSPWLTAWLMWGGNPGRAWADREKARRATMEEKGETLMAMTLPTVEGQGLGDFLEELRDAVTRRLRGSVPMGTEPWIRIEEDTITADSVVGEICGTGEDAYYRMTYSRGEDGRLVLSEPVRVEEVTTYVDVATGPNAGIVSMHAVPVYAPEVENLVRGRRMKVLAVGPLHDINTGELVINVTDELCAELAAAGGLGFGVPVDHGHELWNRQADGKPHDDVPLFGRASEFEAVPGVGLFARLDWGPKGTAKLADEPGLNFISPTICRGAFEPAGGAKVASRRIHSLSLTPTPRQPNADAVVMHTTASIDSLALARAAAGAESPKGGPMGLKDGAGTDKPADAVTLSRTEHDALMLARTERDAFKAEADAAKADVVALAQRLDAVEKARHAEAVAAEVKGYEAKGHIVPDALRAAVVTMSAEVRACVLGSTEKRAVVALGHGGTVEPTSPEDRDVRIITLAREKGISLAAAAKEVGL